MRKTGQMKPCSVCGTLVFRKLCRMKDRPTVYCTRACYEVWWKANRPVHQTGAQHYNWKGGDIRRVCKQCDVEFFVGRNHLAETRNFCSLKCRGAFYSGSNNHLWKGGITPVLHKLRHTPEYREWRKAVYQRDNYRCVLCLGHPRLLHAHHIRRFVDYPELRFVVDNGVTLCRPCHVNVHTMELNFEPLLRSRILRDFTSDTRIPLDAVKIKSDLCSDAKRLAEMSSPVALLS